jgi:hypothetical protein
VCQTRLKLSWKVNECMPLPPPPAPLPPGHGSARPAAAACSRPATDARDPPTPPGRPPIARCTAVARSSTRPQGLTLVHFSAQFERCVWDRGCTKGLCSPCCGGLRGCIWCAGCFLVSDTAQVELRSLDECTPLPVLWHPRALHVGTRQNMGSKHQAEGT